jgi:tRNA(Ile)-lysidine synthase
MELPEQFKQNWAAKKFSSPADVVLLAVSGGMDSMVMADIFLESHIKFSVAHCNFQLRGEAANQDEALVYDWCIANNIAFHKTRFDTQQKADEWKKGIQETARILRYEWLEAVRQEYGYAVIATAHHANDNMETLLMNLFKGTGISGLHGIPERNGYIIRPLLFAPKEELTAYCQGYNVYYREDTSNASDKYLRNAVRHHIIPVVKEWFPNVVQNVNESINRFSQAGLLYQKAIVQERKKLLEKRGQDFYLSILKLQKSQPLETICYELFVPYGFTSAQVPHILQLLDAESGRFVVSQTHRIIRNRDFLILTSVAQDNTDFINIEGAPCTVDTGKYHFSFSIEKKPAQIPADSNMAIIDLEKVTFPLTLRRWRTGDYFYPIGMGMKKKKLSNFLIDQKVPLHEKEHIWVLESEKRIAWITGMRLDERFKVKDNTQDVLVIRVLK